MTGKIPFSPPAVVKTTETLHRRTYQKHSGLSVLCCRTDLNIVSEAVQSKSLNNLIMSALSTAGPKLLQGFMLAPV
ncbi:hypothetical protein HUJ05_005650 [Dendroctonus ponderosae]|nr:hypothetical protein HUJ05_005650 [Dendroctonus ponderosae]